MSRSIYKTDLATDMVGYHPVFHNLIFARKSCGMHSLQRTRSSSPTPTQIDKGAYQVTSQATPPANPVSHLFQVSGRMSNENNVIIKIRADIT